MLLSESTMANGLLHINFATPYTIDCASYFSSYFAVLILLVCFLPDSNLSAIYLLEKPLENYPNVSSSFSLEEDQVNPFFLNVHYSYFYYLNY